MERERPARLAKRREYEKNLYWADIDKSREDNRLKKSKWRNSNPEESRKKKIEEYKKAHSNVVLHEKLLNRARKYRSLNREKLNAANRRWNKETGNYRIYRQRRRARELMVENSFSKEDWRLLVARSKRCYWCKKLFNGRRRPTHDHVIPLAKGGGNTVQNSVCACAACNSRKCDRLVNPVTGQGILL
jgi:hypothetical protein